MGLLSDVRAVYRGDREVLDRSDARVQRASTLSGVYAGSDLRNRLRAAPLDVLDLVPQAAARAGALRRRRRCCPAAAPALEELRRSGATVVADAIPPELLARLRKEFGHVIEAVEHGEPETRVKPASTGGWIRYAVHEHQADLGIHRSHDPLMFSGAIAELATLPLVTDLLAGYLGTGYQHQAWIATRTAPALPERTGFAQWHHDARGRKLNLLFLLNGVADDGQATVYLMGSHRFYYSFARRRRNFFTDEEVEVLRRRHGLQELVCSGSAGSLVVFDSNGLHRGRRGPGTRDVVQLNAMNRPSHRWPHRMDRKRFDSLPATAARELQRRTRLELVS